MHSHFMMALMTDDDEPSVPGYGHGVLACIHPIHYSSQKSHVQPNSRECFFVPEQSGLLITDPRRPRLQIGQERHHLRAQKLNPEQGKISNSLICIARAVALL
jgi:hypothetical protein